MILSLAFKDSDLSWPQIMVFELRENIPYLVGGCLVIVVSIIGLIGNVFTMFIVSRKQLWKHIFYKLLFGLACFDIIAILGFGLEMSCFCLFGKGILDHIPGYVLAYVGLYGSVYLTVMISLERYLGICKRETMWRRNMSTYVGPIVIAIPIAVITALSERNVFFKMRKTVGILGWYNFNVSIRSEHTIIKCFDYLDFEQ